MSKQWINGGVGVMNSGDCRSKRMLGLVKRLDVGIAKANGFSGSQK